MTSSTLLMRRTAATVFAAGLLLSACGSSGGSDSEKKETTTTAAKTTTTTEADAATTTEASGGGTGPTAEQLATILPKVEEMGGTYAVDETEQGVDSAIETATKEQCSDAAALLAPAEDGEPTVAFIDDEQTTVRVTLSAGVDPIDAADAQAIVDSINDCDAVTADDGGLTITASFDAEVNDQYGDGGIQIAVSVNIVDGTNSYDLKKYRAIFTVGTVGVTITGSDGLLDDGTVNAINTDGLDAIATEMAKRAGSL